MFTEEQACRLKEILMESVGLPRGAWLDRVEKELPNANVANVRMALDILAELASMAVNEAKAQESALRNLLYALQRAQALSGKADMTVAEAEAYTRELATGGNIEAQKLIPAFDDPFAEL
jgi:hypothetical protein